MIKGATTVACSVAALCLCVAAAAQTSTPVLRSPNGELAITFETMQKKDPAPQGGQLVYSVTFQGKPLLERSALRLELQGMSPLGNSVRIVRASEESKEEAYTLVTGKTSSVRDRYNALRVEVEETTDLARKLTVEARAFNDGIAFRYVVPEQALMRELRLTKEATEFRISKDPIIYGLFLPNMRSMYESEFIKLSASSLSNQGGVSSSVLLGLPLLMDVPGVAWMAITEAALEDYASMYLVNPSGNWEGHWFESKLSPDPTDPDICVSAALPHHSPWRVLMVGTTPGKLIESNILTSLNPPSVISDTSWIRAGKASWDWWSGSIGPDGKPAFNTATMKYYVDFAAKSGLEYMLVDAGWSAINDITKMNGRVDIPELVQYAKSKGVKVWIWLYWSAVDRQMDEAFPLFEKWGVAGMKIDFMSRDDQTMMHWYYRVAKKAAEHHLMVDYHGSTKPWGMARTYPNAVGYEAVLGMEQSKAGSRDNPDSHVMLPFTRMLAGPMDYTPGAFHNVNQDQFVPRMTLPVVMGTRAHQLAMYAVFEAAFQMVSDAPSSYEGQPGFDFIRHAPATWDETRVLNGVPGEYITIARRKGDEWFLGSMTNWNPRELDLPLSFLGSGGYTAEIYADAADAAAQPEHLKIETKTVNSGMTLKAPLASGGGYAVRFYKGGAAGK